MPEVKFFYCLKCMSKVELVYLPGMQKETFLDFEDRLNAGLCRDCFKPVKKEEQVCLH